MLTSRSVASWRAQNTGINATPGTKKAASQICGICLAYAASQSLHACVKAGVVLVIFIRAAFARMGVNSNHDWLGSVMVAVMVMMFHHDRGRLGMMMVMFHHDRGRLGMMMVMFHHDWSRFGMMMVVFHHDWSRFGMMMVVLTICRCRGSCGNCEHSGCQCSGGNKKTT